MGAGERLRCRADCGLRYREQVSNFKPNKLAESYQGLFIGVSRNMHNSLMEPSGNFCRNSQGLAWFYFGPLIVHDSVGEHVEIA